MGFWPLVLRVLREADIVLLVADARMPSLSRNHELETMANRMNKRLVIVFNKCDLLSSSNLGKLKAENAGAFFVSGTKNKGINGLRDYLSNQAEKFGFGSVKIGVVGYPNVGKSVVINALLGTRVNKVAASAGMTRKIAYGKLGRLKVIDTPGVIPFDDKEAKLGLIAAKNPEDIKNPEKLVIRIIDLFLSQNPNSLGEYYKIDVDDSDSYSLFSDIGRKRGFLLKKGEIDEHRTAMQIIMDWQRGRIKL